MPGPQHSGQNMEEEIVSNRWYDLADVGMVGICLKCYKGLFKYFNTLILWAPFYSLLNNLRLSYGSLLSSHEGARVATRSEVAGGQGGGAQPIHL